MLSPIHHGSQAADADLYKVEPYVVSADVYGAPPHTGRGGWTWYTGAAGWMYRLAVETLMGLRLEVDKLRLAPCIPDEWESYKIHYRYRETFYHITVRQVASRSEAAEVGAAKTKPLIRITSDGGEPNEPGPLPGTIPLVDDRQDHYVDVELFSETA